jgi:tripartite-type tricarboxylate transporter receptor subunit TctC
MSIICRRTAALALLLATGVAALPTSAPAQTWPERTVRFILPLGGGSGADIGARMIADRLTKKWGHPVVVENRPGADGVLAINTVLNARDDHVLLFGPSSSFVGHPYTLERVPYDRDDLLPIARVSSTVVAVAAPPSLGINSLKELIGKVRAEPGKLNWTSITNVTDIIIGGFLKSSGLDMARVPYRNPVQALTDAAEGRIQMYVAAFAIVRSQAQAGRVKLLAVTNGERAPAVPDVPTVAEAGFPGLTFDGNVGLFGPPVVPPELREKIAADVIEAVADPEVTKRLETTGQLVRAGGPAEFAAAIKEQAAALAATAKTMGIKPK